MKKLFYMISVVAFMASFASCNKIEQGNTPVETPSVDGTTTITVSASVPQTKTNLFVNEKNESVVRWSADDVIAILAEGYDSVISDLVSKAAENYDFIINGWYAGVTPQYAAFTGPYTDEKNYAPYKPSWNEDGTILMTVRSGQPIYNQGSFAKIANISLGELVEKEGGFSTEMKNVCGLLKFTLTKPTTSVVIEDKNGGCMCGRVNVKMVNGIPESTLVDGTGGKITLTSKIKNSGNLLAHDESQTYYAVVIPGTYTPMITITPAEGDPIVLTAKKPITIERSKYIDLGELDTSAEEGGDEPVEPEQDTINITVDFSNEPFTTDIGSSEVEDVENEYVLKNSTYVFKIWSQTGYKRKTQNGSMCLHIAQNDPKVDNVSPNNGYIQLPGISGYKLSNVEVTINNTAKKTFYVYSQNPKQNPEQDAFVSISVSAAPSNGVATSSRALGSSVEGTAYYLYAKGQNNAGITKLVLTYTK